ncbi:MAG: hypothetical protein KDE14_12380 [Rhodobacteraceae bacterium]|nr:hypothetical protein [Paracoccaceae bacterium]
MRAARPLGVEAEKRRFYYGLAQHAPNALGIAQLTSDDASPHREKAFVRIEEDEKEWVNDKFTVNPTTHDQGSYIQTVSRNPGRIRPASIMSSGSCY